MSLYLVLGGSKSGKSDVAQNFAKRLEAQGRSVAVGVFGNPTIDPEFKKRIDEHKAKRPESFKTIEAYEDPFDIFEASKKQVLLVDDLGSALGALADRAFAQEQVHLEDEELNKIYANKLRIELRRFVDELLRRPEITIVVSSELGLSLVPPYAAGRLFSDAMGLANQRLAERAAHSYLVIAGRVLNLKALQKEIV